MCMEELPAWTPEALAQRAGISVRTTRRWRQTGRLPPWAAVLVRVLFGGELGLIDPAWSGWHLVRGNLCSRENWYFPPGEVLSIPLMRGQLSAWRNRLAWSTQADWVERKFVYPGETDATDALMQRRRGPKPREWTEAQSARLAPGLAARRKRASR